MPGPRDIPGGEPERPRTCTGPCPAGRLALAAAAAGGFALIYRVGTYVISRFGDARNAWPVAGGRVSDLVVGEPFVREGVLAIRLGGVLGLS